VAGCGLLVMSRSGVRFPEGGSTALIWANNLGQSLLWTGGVLTSLIPLPLVESIVVRDRLLLRWDCRDMRVGMADAVRVRVQSNTCERRSKEQLLDRSAHALLAAADLRSATR
jgi:hypothetical protein